MTPDYPGKRFFVSPGSGLKSLPPPADNIKYMEQQYPSLQGFEVADDQSRQEVAPPKKLRREKGRRSVIWDYVETIFIALLMAVILRVFLVSAYRVSSGSMEDTLLAGDYIFVSKLAYEMSPPKLGDVIVFENPYDPTRDYIKRIVAAITITVTIALVEILYRGFSQTSGSAIGPRHSNARTTVPVAKYHPRFRGDKLAPATAGGRGLSTCRTVPSRNSPQYRHLIASA